MRKRGMDDIPKMTLDSSLFDRVVENHFGFVGDLGGIARGSRHVGGADPRDAALTSRFVGPDWQLEIGWSSFELSLAILVKLDRPGISGSDRYLFFEPFVELLTAGRERAIVPYITENMSIRNIEDVMDRRRSVFAHGLEPVVESLGKKLKSFLPRILSASIDDVRAYHVWISRIR